MSPIRVAVLASTFAVGLVAVACSSTGASAVLEDSGAEGSVQTVSDAGVDSAMPSTLPYPAQDPSDPPQVITVGGPVMTAPKIVPVFFANDDKATTASITDFVKRVGQTHYWKAIVTEYGAGAATSLDPIVLTATDNPNKVVDDSEIQTWLAAKLNANDPAFGTPDANTLYALFYPPGITVTLGGGGSGADGGMAEGGAPGDGGTGTDGSTPEDGGSDGGGPGADAGPDAGQGGGGGVQASCSSFGGYHQNITLDASHQSMNVAYAVIPRCATFGNLNGLDAITGTASHEFVEAVTDPFPLSNNPGYAQVDDGHIYWMSFLGGGEIGDLCAQSDSSFTKFAELPYTVQRSWSNKAEKAGLEPCVPQLPGEVYFNTFPTMKDAIPYTIQGQTITVTGVHIAVGQSKTIPLHLFSDGPTTAPWAVHAIDGAQARKQPAQLAFTFDKSSGVNGDTLQMTIQVLTASRRNRETFAIVSKLGTQVNLWLGLVGN